MNIEKAQDDLREIEAAYDSLLREKTELKEQLAAMTAERDAARNLLQMVKDRIEQSPSGEDNWMYRDDAVNCVTDVAKASGNKCDDDSLWFSGKDWQKLTACKEQVDEKEAQLAALRSKLADVESMQCSACATGEALKDAVKRRDAAIEGLITGEMVNTGCDCQICVKDRRDWIKTKLEG